MPTDTNEADTYQDPIVVACDKYLESLGVVLWETYDISKPDSRWDAAIRLAGILRDLVPGYLDPKLLARDAVRKRYPMTSID